MCGMSGFGLSLCILCVLLEAGSLLRVRQITPPVCHVVNGSLDCPIPCWGSMWEVTLLMMGSSVHPHISVISDTVINVTSVTTFKDAPAEHGEKAIIITHRSSCCKHKVNISAVDENGHQARCDFSIQWPSTTETPENTVYRELLSYSNSLRVAISPWTILLLLATSALFL